MILFLIVISLLLTALIARAHPTETITSFGVTNYTGYLIAGDAVCCGDAYNREHILAGTTIQYSTANNLQLTYDYQVVYRLWDGTNAVPLRLANGTTNLSVVVNDSVELPTDFFNLKTVNRNYVGALQPAARLDPYRQYTVEVELFERPSGLGRFDSTGDIATDGPRSYKHFTSTNANDAEFNVIPVLTSAPFSQTFAVNTIPDKDAVRAAVQFQLHRYDGFLVSNPGSQNIPVALDLELRENLTGVVVPLAQTSTNLSIPVLGHDLDPSGFFIPRVVNAAQTVLFKPAAGVQLDPLKFYRGVVTLRHRETVGGPLLAGNATTNSATRLLHFGGDLYFGAIQTRFTSIDNAPPPAFILADGVQTLLGVDNQKGYVVGQPNHTYGDGTDLWVVLQTNGVARYVGNTPVDITEPLPDTNTVNHIRFLRGVVQLSTNGANASFAVWYPTGFGTNGNVEGSSRFMMTPYAFFFNQQVGQSLLPLSNPTSSSIGWGSEETKPFWFQFSSQTWDIANGRFVFTPTGQIKYTRATELNTLLNAPVVFAYKTKPSNERHLSAVDAVLGPQVIIAADPQRDSARLYADVKLVAGGLTAHFPYGASMRWSNATTMTISNDLVSVGTSRLTEVSNVVVRYTRDCTDPDCTGGQGETGIMFHAAGEEVYFTKDGGLTAKGAVITTNDVTWGWIGSANRYAHRVQAFAEAGYHMPGFFLRGGETTLSPTNRPAVLLYTGIGTNSSTEVDFSRVERPLTPAYSDDYNGGFGDYAGLNFRVGLDGDRQADSTLAAKPTGYYPLTGRSKYYVRKGGVSGVHEAVFGSFPPTNNWYGYAFQVSNFGLAFLDSQNVDSRTEGSVFVKSPSVVTQAFEKLTFNCLGGLESAQVPPGEQGKYKELDYWKADFVPLAISFQRDPNQVCDPGKGTLVLGVQAHAQPFPGSLLFGELGFKPDGDLVTIADGILPDFGSRLKLPSNLSFPGPSGEKWRLTPVCDAYFNKYENAKNDHTAGDQGWLNIVGKLDAPFYEDLQVHMHCSPDKDGSSAPIHLMGGWPNKGYEDFFTQTPADTDNTGFPKGTATIDAYHKGNQNNGQWEVRAKRLWLEVVDFDYPLYWDSVARSFRSAKEETDKLLVLEVKHQIKYLSPDNADITFGAQYSGIPQINLANIAYDQLGGLQNAVKDVVDGALDEGMKKLTETLSAQADALFKPAFDGVIRPVVGDLVHTLHVNYPTWSGPDFSPAINTMNNQLFVGGNSLFGKFKTQFVNPAGQAIGFLNTLNGNLDKVLGAIEEIERILQKAPAEGGAEIRNIVRNLMTKIVGEVAGQFAGYFVPDEVNSVLQELNPTFDQLLSAAQTLHSSIQKVRDALDTTKDFGQELINTFNTQTASISNLLIKTEQDMTNIFKQFDLGQIDNPFNHYTEAQLTDLFMQKVQDRFFGSSLSSLVREAIKHRLYDLDAAIRQTTDSMFQQANVAIRDIISEAAQQLSSEITPMLDDISAYAGAGKMNGYAHINGDDLKELRIDAYAQLKVPSEMEFHGYLLIRELNSQNFPAGCLSGGTATEVTLGADNIPIKFASTDARLAAQAKITLADNNAKLLGIAGGIDLDGKIVLGPVNVKKLSAALAFGKEENYFSAACRVAVNSYEGFGGIFFGRTCSLEPFNWDPEIKQVIGKPPFTGAYGYVEVWIPVSEALLGIPASCMFQVSAGMGMGAGFFLEGPTFLGKAMLGVSGDFLCVASISGDIKLAGKGSKSGITMLGSGTFEVELCVLVCVSASKTVEVKYTNGSWDIDF